MFKKILRAILDELELGKLEFGGMTFYKVYMAGPDSKCEYRLIFNVNEQHIQMQFEEDCNIFVQASEDINYFSVSSKTGITHFHMDIPRDSYIRLDIENAIIETLIRNNIKFEITTKEGGLLLSVNNSTRNFKLEKIQDYILIKNPKAKDESNPEFGVFIPDDSEIRIYV